jgi:hypothetical protein|tara:strand:+ start:485 stop:892 length:408 start_codon:yes stop_codon:yes gene_type:complete
MLEEIKKIKSEKNDLKKFGITIAIILMIIAGLLFWSDKASFQIFLTVGSVFYILGIAIPVVLKPIYQIWMIFAIILGWCMTRVILIFIYFLIFTPIGLIGKIIGHQFLEKNWVKSLPTYWNYRLINEEKNARKQY